MQNARDVLTPDALTMLQVIAEAGSFAAAARQLGLVPSAPTPRERRVAPGWEPQLTLSIDGIISPRTMLELVDAFCAMKPPTRLKLRGGIMTGTLEALTSGRADLAIGVSVAGNNVAGLQQGTLGD